METLSEWLKWLAVDRPASDVARTIVRIFVPGHRVMNFNDWLMTTEQPMAVPPGFRSGHPESMAILAYVDAATHARNMIHHQRLSGDIAAAMTLALNRRIDIPHEISARIENHDIVGFLPIGGLEDRVTMGPLPSDTLSPVAEVFRNIAGLPDDDVPAIGAAASMLHGAVLLHERDVRSAYTLLVAGIEALSRPYGCPPIKWEAWE